MYEKCHLHGRRDRAANLTWEGNWFALAWMEVAHFSPPCLSLCTSLEHWQFGFITREG